MAFSSFLYLLYKKRQVSQYYLLKEVLSLDSCCSAMGSSNSHWPSMFRSKPCTNHHPWQNEAGPFYHRNPLSSDCEQRSPDPKPRWSPRPEQIRILEAIFNSGVVNPPRDEIRRIRVRLQEYGQVGDANVFYWFQNRKSRSKNRQRHLHAATRLQRPRTPKPVVAAAAATCSSSSSSEHSTVLDKATLPNPAHLHGPAPVLHFGSGGDSALCPGQPGYTCLPATANIAAMAVVPEHQLWRELLGGADDGREYFKMQLHHLYTAAAGVPTALSCVNASASFDGPESEIQELRTGGGRGAGEGAIPDQSCGTSGASSTVFTSEAALEVAAGRLNVRETFGQEVVLLDHSDRALLTDEGDFNVLPVHNGAAYYLV